MFKYISSTCVLGQINQLFSSLWGKVWASKRVSSLNAKKKQQKRTKVTKKHQHLLSLNLFLQPFISNNTLTVQQLRDRTPDRLSDTTFYTQLSDRVTNQDWAWLLLGEWTSWRTWNTTVALYFSITIKQCFLRISTIFRSFQLKLI